MSAGVGVAIANWNGRAHIGRCLDAVFSQTLAPAEVVVVDNGSTDGSPDLVAQFPEARLVRLNANEGFCRGYNLAISQTISPFILILNTDVFLDRDFLCRAVEAIGSCPGIGSVAPQIRDVATGAVAYRGLFLRPWIGVTNGPGDEGASLAFGGSGSALLCRREMLDDVAVDGCVLDESFFAYLEDVDLAWRAQLRGWHCFYEPGAVALHVGSASMEGRVRVIDKPPFFQRHIWKNRYLLLLGNASIFELAVLAPWLVLFEMLMWLYLLVRLPWRLHVFLLAHIDVVLGIFGALRKRRYLAARRRVPDGAMLRFFQFWRCP